MKQISAMRNGICSMANVKTGSKLIPKLMKPDSNQVKYVESKQLKRQNKRIKRQTSRSFPVSIEKAPRGFGL